MSSSYFQPILPGNLMHKNKLQEYTQKSGLPDPAYQTNNEGYQHAPKYRATVVVDGVGYTSSELTLHHRKIDAEQEVAKYALECIAKKEKEIGQMITERDPLILQGSLLCKSILYEFATKTNRKIPTYITNGTGPGPTYVSSMVFDGQTYFGEVAASKKKAEQLAASTGIRALLRSNAGNFLRKIVESKGKICSTPHCTTDSSSYKESLPTAFQPGSGDHSEQPKNAPVEISCIEKKILPKPFPHSSNSHPPGPQKNKTCSQQPATIPVRDQIFEKKTFPRAFKPGPGNSSQQRRNVWVKNQGCDKKMLPKPFWPENSSRQPRNTLGEAVLPSSGRMIRPNAGNIRKPENREMAQLKKSRHDYTVGFI